MWQSGTVLLHFQYCFLTYDKVVWKLAGWINQEKIKEGWVLW